MGNYFINAAKELKKVVWPEKRDTAKNTGIVIISSMMIAAFFWAIDTGVLALLKLASG